MSDLRRVMGFWDLVLFYVVTTFSIRWIATAAAAGPSSLVVWVIACITFFIPLAYCVLRLSSMYPDEGGLYIWTKQAFGDFAGFMTGWNYWGSQLPYFPSLLYFAAGNALFIGGASWQRLSTSSGYFIVASVLGLTLGVVLNLAGLDISRWLHNIGALTSWGPALLLVAMAPMAWVRFGAATPITFSSVIPGTHLKDVIFWSTIAFAFSGVESASVMAGEIRDAKKIIPPALLLSGIIMAVFYLAATASLLIAVPQKDISGLQGITQAIDAVASRSGVRAVVPFAAAMVTISSIGGVAAWFATSGRLPFVAGVDRYLPEAFGRLHPRWGTPYVSLWLQAAIALVIVILGQAGTTVKGAYDVLVSMSLIAYFIPYLFMFAAFVKLDRRPSALIWGSLGFVTTTVSIVLAAIPSEDDPNKVLTLAKTLGLTALMIGMGVVLYWRRRSARA